MNRQALAAEVSVQMSLFAFHVLVSIAISTERACTDGC